LIAVIIRELEGIMHPMYRNVVWCKIDGNYISKIKNAISQSLVSAVEKLQGREFTTEDEFLKTLREECESDDPSRCKELLPTEDLRQGDILDRGRLIRQGTLRGHQDYIATRTDFLGFCVVTQTCDLVYNRCIDFIHLAVIRRIADVIPSEDATQQELKKLINHRSDPKDGYFYLHREARVGLNEDAIVDLRTMFSLHRKHYRQLLRARTISLNDIYACKLGWTAAYLFSRVALPEWNEHEERTGESEKAVIERLKSSIKGRKERLCYEQPHFGVALTDDMPTQGVCRGQVGTVIEELPSGYRVDFYDDNGVYVTLDLKPTEVVELKFQRPNSEPGDPSDRSGTG
jgi:Domain of unknown function (DUF4926)